MTNNEAMDFNEREIVKQIILPIGARLSKKKTTDKLCQIINCNVTLSPVTPLLSFGGGIRETAYNYLYNELQWYLSHDLNIKHHPGIENNPVWQRVASDKGFVNSNYGYLVFDKGNHSQYDFALSQLVKKKHTKHAVIQYSRPEIVQEWNNNINAKSDYICTYSTSFMVQDNKLHMCVNMRSNDFTTGFMNDFAWQVYVYKKMLADIQKHHELEIGNIYWHADNMHVYERDYDLLLKLYDYYKGRKL